MKNDIEQIAKRIRFRGSLSELKKGVKVESEHAMTVGKSPVKWAMIARDHLRKNPRYYTMLKKCKLK